MGFVSLYLCNRWGRKKSILGTTSACALFILFIALIPLLFAKHRSILNIFFALCGKFFISASYSAMYIWSFEIYPTVIRSQGLSFCAVLENTGGMVAPFLVET